MDKLCLVNGCGSKFRSRGLCNTHYITAIEMVRRGETTWEELVSVGLAKAPHSRPKRSLLREQLEAARKAKESSR